MISKSMFMVLFIVLLLLALSPVAHADIVMGNEFLYAIRNKTVDVNKQFIVNSSTGYVVPKEKPGSHKGVTVEHSYKFELFSITDENEFMFLNGDIITIEYAYRHGGSYWGITKPSHTFQPSGWIPMDELRVYYDNVDFMTEHKNELHRYTGGFDELSETEAFYLWQWPGSDMEKIKYDSTVFDSDTYRGADTYLDNEGREWVYIIIFGEVIGNNRRTTAGWICLSDPENSSIPAFNPAPAPTKWVPGGTPEGTFSMRVLIVASVSMLVVGTAVLIVVFWKPGIISREKK